MSLLRGDVIRPRGDCQQARRRLELLRRPCCVPARNPFGLHRLEPVARTFRERLWSMKGDSRAIPLIGAVDSPVENSELTRGGAPRGHLEMEAQAQRSARSTKNQAASSHV